MRHEDVDDHQVECHAFQGPKPGLTAIGDRHLEIVPDEIGLDGRADHWIVIDDENMRHAGSPRRDTRIRWFGRSWIVMH